MQVKHLSASLIGTFDQCPMKYYANYVLGMKETEIHPNTRMGSAVHKSIEKALKTNKDAIIPSEPLQYLPEQLKELGIPELEKDARGMINTAVEWGYMNPENLYGIECGFEFPLEDNTIVRGFIDRLNYNPTSKMTGVMDLKTGKTTKNEQELAKDWQARIYNIAARTLLPDTQTCTLTFWYLRKQRVTIMLTAEDAALDKLKLKGIADTIRATEPTCKPSSLCKWCVYYKECPAMVDDLDNLKSRLKNLLT